MRTYMLLATLLLLLSVVGCYFRVSNERIVDAQGGERLFHGLNVVMKVPPYLDNFTEKDMKLFKEWGINGIRLGVMWSGVEPVEGQFNETYLQQVKNLVETAGKYNIYTLVEFHQDLFSEKFCADGVPVWAIPDKISQSFPRPLQVQRFPYNDSSDPSGLPIGCGKHAWASYYLSYSVNQAFEALWTNKHHVRDKFIRYWRKVAATFNHTQEVIAYELINEPWPGNFYQNPLVMVPGLSELIHMQSAYDIIAQQIKQIDPNHNICFQPVTWLNNFPTGFSHPPGGFKNANQSIFCYHFYQPPSLNLQAFMSARMKDKKKLKSAGLLSEFYVINEQGQHNIEMMDLCDQNLQSWFGWIYIQNETLKGLPLGIGQKIELDQYMVKGLYRVYAHRVAGQTIDHKYDPLQKSFLLSYYICVGCGSTVIYLSEKHIYTQGYQFECHPAGKLKCTVEEDIYLKVEPDGIQENTFVMITINSL